MYFSWKVLKQKRSDWEVLGVFETKRQAQEFKNKLASENKEDSKKLALKVEFEEEDIERDRVACWFV